MTPTGTGNVVFTDTLPRYSRRTYDLSSRLPDTRAAIMVESLTEGKGLVVERAMYWNDRGAGTDSVGSVQGI